MNALLKLIPARRSLWRHVGLFCLCLLLTVSCGSPSTNINEPPPESGAEGRVSIGTTLKPRTLDPADAYEVSSLGIIYNMGDRLYTYPLGSTELEPQLATELPTIGDDGLTYTIPLRQGVTFHDGAVFDAEAMAFSLQRFIDNGGKPSFLLSDVVESIEATNDYELTIRLQQPFAAFPALLAFQGACAVSPRAYKAGAGQFSPNTFVGTGPYRLTEFSSDTVRLDVNEDYWGTPPANRGIDLQIYAGNSANLFNAFRTGAVDIAYQTFDPNQIASLLEGAQNDEWQEIAAPGTSTSYMVLNVRQPPLDQKPIRQALAAVIDREAAIARALQGQAEPIYSLVPTSFSAYEPAFERYNEGGTAAAKRLLEEAGVTPENPVELELWYPSGSPVRSQVATFLQAIASRDLEGLVAIEPKSVEAGTAFKNLSEGVYQSFLVDWYPDFLDADNYIHPFLSCDDGLPEEGCNKGGAQTQGSFYYSAKANELIDRQREVQDPEFRREIFAEIQTLLAEDVPYIPLWQSKDYAFARNGLVGANINPSQSMIYSTIALD
ncbi:MAG: ABC transporter substrate-binding protein [Cyanobacteria bacterium J06641_5]